MDYTPCVPLTNESLDDSGGLKWIATYLSAADENLFYNYIHWDPKT